MQIRISPSFILAIIDPCHGIVLHLAAVLLVGRVIACMNFLETQCIVRKMGASCQTLSKQLGWCFRKPSAMLKTF